ncbi:MAG TPA: DNA-formamidopyrimidine glycosylase family protein [Thermoanaerobaculia bacterium]|nr:DNA-formamidopyrimidine glycosylase family protein [Thermoanaerobaculia bacterium]
MPEGDTIARAAHTLRRALAGKSVRSFRSPAVRADLAGRRVDSVESAGKNLLVRFDDGRTLRTHMRMHGEWHLYRPGERWRRASALARAVLETDDWVAVCFSAPVVEMLRPGRGSTDAERSHPALARLGPDIVAEAFDRDEAIARLQSLPDLEIGEALLRQDAVAGIGNIWKSETLFRSRVNPFAAIGALSPCVLADVLDAARRLMRARSGAAREPRRTALAGWEVYRRSGRPCRRCGTAIAVRRQGAHRRSTYWCPRCQGAAP